MLKVIMLTSTWDNVYCGETICGIEKRIENEDVRVDIYNVYDETQKDFVYYKQLELYTLPNLEDYDAMMLTISSTEFLHAVDNIRKEYEKLGRPIVTTDQQFGNIPYCGIDNYAAMYNVVEHVIEKHGAKVLNYVGGPIDYEEDMQRCKAFKDCLKAHGIEHDPKRELHYSFLVNDGVTAYTVFKQRGLEKPDAVICANDHMAIGYCDVARGDGLEAPRDFIITGYDNVEMGQTYMPSITSLNRDRKTVGYEAMDYLLRLLKDDDNKEIPTIGGYVAENESCGCAIGKRDIRNEYDSLIGVKRLIQDMQYAQDYARNKLCSSTTLDQFQQAMVYSRDRLNIEPFVICLSQTFFEGKYETEQKYYTDKMNYYAEDEKGMIYRSKDGLLPQKWIDEHIKKIMVISPLVFGYQTQGYCVAPWNEFFFTTGNHRTFVDTLSLALENISQRITLDGMNQQLQKLYVRDSLTNLYNRFGYASLSNGFFEKNMGRVYIVYVDLDNLKHINDCYGHSMGDVAIKGAAEVIKRCFDDTDIVVRMGGDEFLVLGQYINEDIIKAKEKQVAAEMEAEGKKSNLPVKLEASIGYVVNEGFESNVNLESLVSMADKRMYEIKQMKKKLR